MCREHPLQQYAPAFKRQSTLPFPPLLAESNPPFSKLIRRSIDILPIWSCPRCNMINPSADGMTRDSLPSADREKVTHHNEITFTITLIPIKFIEWFVLLPGIPFLELSLECSIPACRSKSKVPLNKAAATWFYWGLFDFARIYWVNKWFYRVTLHFAEILWDLMTFCEGNLSSWLFFTHLILLDW